MTKVKQKTMASIALPGLVSPHDLSEDRQFAMNLARGLEVLRAFTPMDPVLGNRDLYDRTGLPKPTISRLTYTLTLLGYLNYDERLQKYRLGSGVLSLGYPLLSNLRIRQLARPYMQEIIRQTGCTVNIGIRDRTCVVYIETCSADAANAYRPDIGTTSPILVSSIGRALLLASPVAERTAVMNRLRLDDPERFEREYEFFRRDEIFFAQHRFCYSQGDWRKEIHAIGAPIRLPDSEPQVAINCTMARHRLARDTMETDIAPLMLEAVRCIENAYGLR